MVPRLNDLDLILFFDDRLVSSEDNVHISSRFPNYDVRLLDIPFIRLGVNLIFRSSEMINSEDKSGVILTRLIEQESDLSLIRNVCLLIFIYVVGLDFLLIFMKIVDVNMVLPFFMLYDYSHRTVLRHLFCFDFLDSDFFRSQSVLNVVMRVVFINQLLKAGRGECVLTIFTDTFLFDITESLLKCISDHIL